MNGMYVAWLSLPSGREWRRLLAPSWEVAHALLREHPTVFGFHPEAKPIVLSADYVGAVVERWR